jgi:hypothetical protein
VALPAGHPIPHLRRWGEELLDLGGEGGKGGLADKAPAQLLIVGEAAPHPIFGRGKKDGSCRLRGGGAQHGAEECRRHLLKLVGPFEDGHIVAQQPLAAPTKRAEDGASPGPDAFERRVVHLTDAVPIIVPRPFTAPGRVADRRMDPSGCWQAVVGLPLVRVDGGMWTSVRFNEGR